VIRGDVNDLTVMQEIGFSACPADAATKILEQADHNLTKKYGEGCVREFN
jgi:3-deoxy-D-manno-octulosonate 8-phosphate phosphatase (KDO 8-P phosphatase)